MTISAVPENNFPKARFGPSYLSVTIEKIFKQLPVEIYCESLEGDASDRSYFRISLKSKIDRKIFQSLIIMQIKEPVPEQETDFTRILKFLRKLDLPVPELFYYDVSMGLLFLEDCGTITLEDQVKIFPQHKAKLYRQAVKLLFDMQTQATRAIDSTCPAYHLKFNVEKLIWEFNFMLDNYVDKLCRLPLKNFAKKELNEAFIPLCESLAEEELYFTHRDYHSRNLMFNEDQLVLIDFQDARMGPCQYDLVSLLKDSYMQVDDVLVQELIDFYIQLKEQAEGRKINREKFKKIFDGMSIQRNLKAIGTFAYQSVNNNNNRYVGYISPTLDYVRQALKRRFEGTVLEKILLTNIPGLDGKEVQEL